MYELGANRVSFDEALRRLEGVNPALYNRLKKIIDSPDFGTARELRNDITHNFLPGQIGSPVRRVSKNHMTFGCGDYIPSAQIKDNTIKVLDLFAASLEAIKEQSAIDHPS